MADNVIESIEEIVYYERYFSVGHRCKEEEMASNQSIGQRLLWVGLFIGIGLILAILVLFFLVASPGNHPPTVRILSPNGHPVISSGEGIILLAEAEGTSPVERIDFLLDDLLIEQKFATAPEDSPMRAMFTWFSTSPGIHKLTVIAYPYRGQASEPENVLVGVLAANLTSPSLDELAASSNGDGNGGEGEEGGEEGGALPGSDEPAPPVFGIEQQFPNLQDVEQQLQDAEEAQDDLDFPRQLDNQPIDAPPVILNFDVSVPHVGGEPTTSALVEAGDDVGVDSIEVDYVNPETQETMSTSMVCLGDLSCTFTDSHALSEGQWFITALAYDISGQASEPAIHEIQVMANGEGLPPAIADLGRIQLCGLNCEVGQLLNQRVSDFSASLGEVAGLLFPDGGDDSCLSLWADSTPEGVLLRLQVFCPYEAPAGQVIRFESMKASSTASEEEIQEPFRPTWENNLSREQLELGETFYFTDEDVFCGTQYTYHVGISYGDPGEQVDGQFNPEHSQTEIEVIPWFCREEDVEGIELEMRLKFQTQLGSQLEGVGYQGSYQIDRLEDWYQGEIPEEVIIQMFKFFPDTRLSPRPVNILRDHISNANNRSGNYFDNGSLWDNDFDLWLDCGRPIVYIFRIRNAQTLELMAQAYREVEPLPCHSNFINLWDFSVGQYYQQMPGGSYHLTTVIDVDIPPGSSIPRDRLLKLHVYPPPGLSGGGQRAYEVNYLNLNLEGMHIHEKIPRLMACGTGDYEFKLVLSKEGVGSFYERYATYSQRSIWVTPLPCMPPKPTINYLHAHMCNDAPCIEVDWTPGVFAQDVRAYRPTEILLQRYHYYSGGTEVSAFHLPIEQTHYTDLDVAPGQTYNYIIQYNYETWYGDERRMFIYTPLESDWDCMVTNEGESDCNE